MSIVSHENFEQFIPSYLSKPDKDELVKNLKSFRDKPYFSQYATDMYLQGDCWAGLKIVSIRTKEEASVKALCLSNSCDIEQSSSFPNKLVFSPIISVENYIERLKKSGADDNRIRNFRINLANQEITNLFYLPKSECIPYEVLVNLSDVYSTDANQFFSDENHEKSRILRLSQMGHYLLLLKISIHFCRFWENVKRS